MVAAAAAVCSAILAPSIRSIYCHNLHKAITKIIVNNNIIVELQIHLKGLAHQDILGTNHRYFSLEHDSWQVIPEMIFFDGHVNQPFARTAFYFIFMLCTFHPTMPDFLIANSGLAINSVTIFFHLWSELFCSRMFSLFKGEKG